MKVVDIGDEIHRELGNPSDLGIPVIVNWLKTNVGTLNNLINTSFYIKAATGEIEQEKPGSTDVEEIGENEKSVFKKLYNIYYYERKLRENIGVGSIDQAVEVSSNGMSVRKVSKTEIMRHLHEIKKQEHIELNLLVQAYKTNLASPRQVAGDDTVSGICETIVGRGGNTIFGGS